VVLLHLHGPFALFLFRCFLLWRFELVFFKPPPEKTAHSLAECQVFGFGLCPRCILQFGVYPERESFFWCHLVIPLCQLCGNIIHRFPLDVKWSCVSFLFRPCCAMRLSTCYTRRADPSPPAPITATSTG
jgi:hypothetical protein